jgi:hypothetical protein
MDVISREDYIVGSHRKKNKSKISKLMPQYPSCTAARKFEGRGVSDYFLFSYGLRKTPNHVLLRWGKIIKDVFIGLN